MQRKLFSLVGWILKGILVFAVLSYCFLFLFVHFRRKEAVLSIIKGKVSDLRKLSVEVPPAVDRPGVRRLPHLHVHGGAPLEYDFQLDNRTTVWQLKYDNFRLPPPLFYTNTSRKLFYKNDDNVGFIGSRQPETIKGEIYLVRNGTYATSLDCGYRADPGHVLVKREPAVWLEKAIPMYTPESWTFQHFIDSALPKIVQVLHILKDRNVTLLFQQTPRDKIVLEILHAIGISSKQIRYQYQRHIGADYLYFTCIAPPIHPVLWQSARRLVGAPETLLAERQREAYVVFVTRKGCHNCGRVVRNEDEVVKLLESRYGTDTVKVFQGGLGLNDTVRLFGNSRIVLGSHGGGMYNINFAPINTTVVEFMPTHPDGRMEAASKKIIWSQAALLGQIYWRVCSSPIPGTRGDLMVDLSELEGILDVTDARLKP